MVGAGWPGTAVAAVAVEVAPATTVAGEGEVGVGDVSSRPVTVLQARASREKSRMRVRMDLCRRCMCFSPGKLATNFHECSRIIGWFSFIVIGNAGVV
jgi:hypothetical protein